MSQLRTSPMTHPRQLNSDIPDSSKSNKNVPDGFIKFLFIYLYFYAIIHLYNYYKKFNRI